MLNLRHIIILLISSVAVCVAGGTALAVPSLTLIKTTGKIHVDADLTDSGWREAVKVQNFVEVVPGGRIKAPVATEAYLTYDDENLYVAFVCHDDPERVRASICERDFTDSDDVVGLFIDTYGEAAWAYELFVNPYGIQMDWLWSGSCGIQDKGFDLIWESAGQVTDSGYQVEISLPFSSLRFPSGSEQHWKVNLWRNHPRETWRHFSWAPYDRNDPCFPCQWADLKGIRDVKCGRGIQVLPSIVGFQSGALSGDGTTEVPFELDNRKADAEASLYAKYAPSSNITIEATVNPDFSQIEADADQIDVNTTHALFFAERRPFFQEGSDLYHTFFNTFYSRSINDPDFAAKATVRFEGTSVAFISARDMHSPLSIPFEESTVYLIGGRSYSNILRVRHSYGSDSHLGILLTDRRMDDGGSGTLITGEGQLSVHHNTRFNWQFIGTYTKEPNSPDLASQLESLIDIGYIPVTFGNGEKSSTFDGESYRGHALGLTFDHQTRHTGLELTYKEVGPLYRPENGFQTTNNCRNLDLSASYTFYPKKGIIERLRPNLNAGFKWNFDGKRKDQYSSFLLITKLRTAQIRLHTWIAGSTEWYYGEYYPDMWEVMQQIEATPSNLIYLRVSVMKGNNIARRHYVPDKEFKSGIVVRLKPFSRMSIITQYNYQQGRNRQTNEMIFKGFIARAKINYQLTKELSLRLVVQYNDFYETWDLDPLVTYRINPFSLIYLGSTFDYARLDERKGNNIESITRLSSRQFFVKLQYLFQL